MSLSKSFNPLYTVYLIAAFLTIGLRSCNSSVIYLPLFATSALTNGSLSNINSSNPNPRSATTLFTSVDSSLINLSKPYH